MRIYIISMRIYMLVYQAIIVSDIGFLHLYLLDQHAWTYLCLWIVWHSWLYFLPPRTIWAPTNVKIYNKKPHIEKVDQSHSALCHHQHIAIDCLIRTHIWLCVFAYIIYIIWILHNLSTKAEWIVQGWHCPPFRPSLHVLVLHMYLFPENLLILIRYQAIWPGCYITNSLISSGTYLIIIFWITILTYITIHAGEPSTYFWDSNKIQQRLSFNFRYQ